jgi:hypothetical protein
MKKQPALGDIPDSIRPLKLKYSARCLCKRSLRSGQTAYYDTVNSKPLCSRCVHERVKQQCQSEMAPGEQTALDKLLSCIGTILRTPLPRQDSLNEELQGLLEKLRVEHAEEQRARQTLIEYFEISLPRSARCIKLGHASLCTACAVSLAAGTAAVWDAAARRTWCFYCASAQPLFRAFD